MKGVIFSTRQVCLITWPTVCVIITQVTKRDDVSSVASVQIKSQLINRFWVSLLPKGNRGNPSHESVGSDTLQVEQATVTKQQQDNVLTQVEALPTLPKHRDVLEEWRQQDNHQHLHPPPWRLDLLVFLSKCCHYNVLHWKETGSVMRLFFFKRITNLTCMTGLPVTITYNNCVLTYQEEHPGGNKHDDCSCTGIKLQFRRAETSQQSCYTENLK